MIGKKIPNPRKTASKAVRIGQLAEYIGNPEFGDPQEKCLYAGSYGFIAEDAKVHRMEMLALAMEAPRSKDPINHYVLSWREGEQPTPEQCDSAVKILLNELGLNEHQAIYGLHSNTDNLHLHVMVNRVHPDTERPVEINNGFDIEALHRAIARIEHEQGWEKENEGRYQVLGNGELARIGYERRAMPTTKARDMEQYTGEKSAQRIGIETVPKIVQLATGWADLHRRLAQEGMRYERKGSGAVLLIGEQPIKASTADRNASLAKLEKRFGPYQAAGPRELPEREAQPLRAEEAKLGWDDYEKARRRHYERKAEAWAELRGKIDRERKALAGKQRQERKQILGAWRWHGKGAELNAMRSVLAAQHAAAQAALSAEHTKEREILRRDHAPFVSYEQWLGAERDSERAEEWRYSRDHAAGIEGAAQAASPKDIRNFVYEIRGKEVHYYSRKGERNRTASFVDTGKRISIHDWRNPDSLLAAMQLAQAKWGQGFVVTGSDEYKAACVRLAAERGFRIENPELQKAIESERARIQEERAQAAKSPQLRAFERYHAAVQADRYFVTSIRIFPGGQNRTTVLRRRGFTPEEMTRQVVEFVRFAQSKESICLAPLSDKRHHIVIDGMDQAKLDRFLADGHRPAAVLETSPGRYHAILTIPKQGTGYDNDVGNRLAVRLNRLYGEPRLYGGIHPHPVPGYLNFSPEHKNKDGSFPEVRLVSAEARECGRTLEIAREIHDHCEQQARKAVPAPANAVPAAADTPAVVDKELSLGQIYDVHRADILARHGGRVDSSRLDSMIALRMRTTKHDRAAIEEAIRDRAPQSRPAGNGETGRWDDYARRAAASAFTPRADRQCEAQDAQHWAHLEGRVQKAEQELQAALAWYAAHGFGDQNRYRQNPSTAGIDAMWEMRKAGTSEADRAKWKQHANVIFQHFHASKMREPGQRSPNGPSKAVQGGLER